MGAANIQSNGNNLAVIESSPARVPARFEGGAKPGESDSILAIVWRQRAVVAFVAGVFVVLTALYLLVATRYYSGYARLHVQQVAPQVLPTGEHAQPAQQPDAFLFTQREVISSTPVLALALGTPGVRDLKTFEGEENLFNFLKKNLSIEVGKKDELISVGFDTPYREEAQKVVAAVVDAYVNYQSKQRHGTASEMLAVLQQERDKRQRELKGKQDELQAFRTQHGIVPGADQKSNVARQKLDSISTALTAATIESISAKSAWDDVSSSVLSTPQHKQAFDAFRRGSGYSAPSALDDAQLRTEMLSWQSKLQEVSYKYGPSHPYRRSLQEKIDKNNILYAAAVFRRMETAQQRELDLQKRFDEQQKLAVAQNAHVVVDARLESEVGRLQTLSDEIDNRIKQVGVTQGNPNAPSITVLESPTVSRSPTRPFVGRTLALALLGGLALGCGAACVRDWYDYRLRSAEEVKHTLGITVLGLIPRVDDESSPIARGQKIHIDPHCEAAEAYRSLRTAIFFGTQERELRTLLVTSPERGDGKTTLASNLAISIAQAGRRVLLIDADLRAPMQDLVFGINGRVGLATVLQGKEELRTAIRHTGIEHLDLLPAGVSARNPSELLNSQKFIDLLEELAESYDQVVIDSPPMLAVTDARIVAASADATLLVLRANKSNRKLGEMSVDGLLSVGAKLLGAVVNDIERRSYSSYGSYGRYGYGHNGRSPSERSVMNDDLEANGHRSGQEYTASTGEGSLPATRGRLTG